MTWIHSAELTGGESFNLLPDVKEYMLFIKANDDVNFCAVINICAQMIPKSGYILVHGGGNRLDTNTMIMYGCFARVMITSSTLNLTQAFANGNNYFETSTMDVYYR